MSDIRTSLQKDIRDLSFGGWKRNLTMAEILMQVMYAQQESAKFKKRLSHIVYMGIGEPLDTVALRC